MVRFSPPESTFAATAPASFHHPRPDSLRSVQGTRPRIMTDSTTRPALPLCRFQSIREQGKGAKTGDRPEDRLPRELLDNWDLRGHPLQRRPIREKLVGLDESHDITYPRFGLMLHHDPFIW